MRAEQNKPVPDDEIDIKSVGNRFYHFTLNQIKLLLNHPLITLLFILLGLSCALTVRFCVAKNYSSTFIIRPNDKNEKFHLKVLGNLETLLTLDDVEGIARELKLTADMARSIDNFSFLNYAYAKNRADSMNATEVTLSVSKPANLFPVQQAIIAYLENNPYFKKITQLQKQNITLRKKLIDYDLAMLDSLKKLQLSSYKALKITEQNSVFLKDLINPTSTYTLALERMNQKTNVLAQEAFIDNFQLVKSVVPSDVHSWPPRLLLLCLVFVPAFLVICLVFLHHRQRA